MKRREKVERWKHEIWDKEEKKDSWDRERGDMVAKSEGDIKTEDESRMGRKRKGSKLWRGQ